MRELFEIIKNGGLLAIKGMTTELGFTTERKRLKTLSECEDWLRGNPKNNIRVVFENEEIKDFS